MTELAILAREVGVHERTLRRAVAEGSLRRVRPSPRTLALSLSEREYVRRSWKLLSTLRTALRTEPNVRFALLFGSAARGTDARGSDVDVRRVAAPLRMSSAADCVRFERESFGAPHQMLSRLSESEREEAWSEIHSELSQFETANGFAGPCELIVAAGTAN